MSEREQKLAQAETLAAEFDWLAVEMHRATEPPQIQRMFELSKRVVQLERDMQRHLKKFGVK